MLATNKLGRRSFLIKGSALLACSTFSLPSIAKSSGPKKIPSAYIFYAKKNNVPAEILYSIAHVESRHSKTASPHIYAMNFKGKSFFFSNRETLYKNALHLLESGFKSFDIGPVQVNWKWHSERFDNDLWLATDPERNLNAGAEYLREQFDKYGDWFTAGGKYHSPGLNKKQLRNYNRYKNRLISVYKELGYA
ncbi:transglycosylase SLT domain-containing protein [Aliivibrio fischeri]|uniref:transglycosylase SLT domain-containing protein n=1 Tax=Aliivibrio fischeri TaxID=668 RepID=UPI0007C58AAB|nr:transglycosylase SLT domain-containing protein [Aliivibrio fischeri]